MIKEILRYLKDNPMSTTLDIAAEMDLDEDGAEDLLATMQEKHLIDEIWDVSTGYAWIALNQNDFGVIE